MKTFPLLAAIGILGVTLVLNTLVPIPQDHAPMGERIGRRIPEKLGEWALVRDLPVAGEEERILGTNDIFHRIYEAKGTNEEIFLSLVFSSGHRHSMHPPEVCYQAGGFTLVSRGEVNLEHDTKATVLRLVRGEDNQLVNYWFFSEGRETASYIVHQIHLVLNQVLIRSQPSVLVRLSTTIEKSDVAAAQQRLSRFAAVCVPVLREKLQTTTQEEEPSQSDRGNQRDDSRG